MEGFSEAVAYELASQNITVQLVIPHGVVTATGFSERQASHSATDPSLTDYDAFVSRITKVFADMTAARMMTADDVARVIYSAVARHGQASLSHRR